MSLFLLTSIYRQILCHCQAIGFDRFKLRPLITLIPHSYHGVLNDILGFYPIQGDSESQSKEFILQRQNIVSEADFLHLYNNDGLGYEKLQSPTTFFLNYFFFILVPPELLIADAKVITTSDTPAFIASKEFSNLGIIPPLNNAISYILFKFGMGDLGGITLSSSFSSRNTPFFSKQYTNITSNKWFDNAFAVSPSNGICIRIQHIAALCRASMEPSQEQRLYVSNPTIK